MPKLIVKAGKVCTLGGKLVTDAEGAPCVCGGGGPTYDCDNLPPCLNVRIDGIQVIPTCEGFKWLGCQDEIYVSEANGYTGRDFIVHQIDDLPIYYAEIPARLLMVDPCDSAIFNLETDTILVSVSLGCQDDRIVVSNFGARWFRQTSGDFGISFWVFESTNRGTPYELGEVSLNDSGPVCGFIWKPFGGGSGSVTIPDQCHDWRWADACEGATQPQSVAYDALTIIPGSSTLVNPDNDARYTLTERFAEDPGPTPEYIYSTDDCGGNPTWPVAVACNGSGSISYDPATIAPGSVTLLWQGARYAPSATTTTQPPVPAVGSPDPCPQPGDPCSVLVPNDPRCNQPEFRNCPQCAGVDVGPPDIRPTNQLNAPTDEDEGGLGDAVAAAIKVLTIGAFKDCSACKRRQALVNRFGKRVAEAVINKLGW